MIKFNLVIGVLAVTMSAFALVFNLIAHQHVWAILDAVLLFYNMYFLERNWTAYRKGPSQ